MSTDDNSTEHRLLNEIDLIVELGDGTYKKENFRVLNNQIIGFSSFAFTWGLMYGCSISGYQGRFCYDCLMDCYDAFHHVTDLGHNCPPPDNVWLVQKGRPDGDRLNPLANIEQDFDA